MSTQTETKCPLTGLDATIIPPRGNYTTYEVKDLKLQYSVSPIVLEALEAKKRNNEDFDLEKGKLLYWVNNEWQKVIKETSLKIPMIDSQLINESNELSPLRLKITPNQKLDWLLEYIYHDMESLGTRKSIPHHELFPILATVEASEVDILMKILTKRKHCLEYTRSQGFASYPFEIETTLEGFEAYEAYKEGKAHSNFGFMALKFSTDDYISPADEIYKNYWKKAVQEAGYPLNALYEKSEAGNINNSMEAQIRKCKFLIADVTPPEDTDTPNPNVMWEAGFAEGLNKPVFYVCDKNKKPKKRVFDIDHHNTLYYDTSKMKEDCEELKATIFNTFAKDAQ
jgi:hypothetical protein